MTLDTGVDRQPFVLSADEGAAYWYVNNRAVIKTSAAQTGGAFGLLEMQVALGHGPPLHIHQNEDEVLWVLEGQLFVRTGDREAMAGPGSCIYTPRGIPHTFRVEGQTPPRLLVLVVPGGGEGFFIDAGRPAAGPGLPPPAPPDIARLQEVATKYHQEFIGPPL